MHKTKWGFLVRLLITILGFFIGAYFGQIVVIKYQINYVDILGALGVGSTFGTYFLFPYINELLIERAKKIEQEREHFLRGLDRVMDYASRYYLPLYRYAFSFTFLLENAMERKIEEREIKYAFFWLGKLFQKRSEFYFKTGGFIKLQDLTQELVSEILFEKSRNYLPLDYYEMTYLIKYTNQKSKTSPLFFDFFIDLDKDEGINKIYSSFKKWLLSPDSEKEVKDLIKYLNCFAFHMRWQLNLMYSGWYQEPIYPFIPENSLILIDKIKKSIETCELKKENIRDVYRNCGVKRL